MNIKGQLLKYHHQLFGEAEIVIAAPGRVNIIGEHTDYNQGLVLPYALDKHIYMAASRSADDHLKVYSADQKRYVDFSLAEGRPPWTKYYEQVMTFIKDQYGQLPELEITMLSDLPIGAGISSSSALTCGVIYLFNHYMDLNLSIDKMIQIATYTEHGVGLKGGAMDQSTILKAKEDQAILMNFGSNTEEYISLNMKGHDFYLVYSDIKHSLVDSEYNIRRKECEQAAEMISSQYKKIDHLSQLRIGDLDYIELPQPLLKRTQFVVEENNRVLEVKDLLKKGDLNGVGDLINDSHFGLSLQYEVSTTEVDWLVNELQQQSAILGARMIGGGFGGSILVLLEGDYITQIEAVVKDYNDKYNKNAYYFNAHSGPALKRIS